MDIVIVGAGGHSRVVADAAKEAGFTLKGFVDINYKGQEEQILDSPVLGGLDILNNFDPKKTAVNIAIGNSIERSEIYSKVKATGFSLPPVIHPTAIVSKFAIIETGSFVNTRAIVNAEARVGENSIINTASIIEHETVIGKHCHIAPGVQIGGRVQIKDNVFVGIGSSIVDYISIGNNAIIGAGSVVLKDVEADATVVGVH